MARYEELAVTDLTVLGDQTVAGAMAITGAATVTGLTTVGAITAGGVILTDATSLPTTDPAVAGQLWADTLIVTVSAGA